MKVSYGVFIAAALTIGGSHAVAAQGYYGNNLNNNGSLAGKNYKGSPGGARTSRIGHGPTDGTSSGLRDTNGGLAGIQTRRARHRGHLRRL